MPIVYQLVVIVWIATSASTNHPTHLAGNPVHQQTDGFVGLALRVLLMKFIIYKRLLPVEPHEAVPEVSKK